MDSGTICGGCIQQQAHLVKATSDLRAAHVSWVQRKEEWERTRNGIPPAPRAMWPKFRWEGPPLNERKNADCALCRLFSAAFFEDMGHGPLTMVHFLQIWAIDRPTEVNDYDDVYIGLPAETRSPGNDPALAISDLRSGPRMFRPLEVPSMVDWSKIRSWLNICTTRDGLLCVNKRAVPGLKLIDCERLTVARAENNSTWVALSYVWALAKPRTKPISHATSAVPLLHLS